MSHELQQYLSFAGIFLNLFLALLALAHSRRNPIYRSFFLLNADLLIWNFSHCMRRSAYFSQDAYVTSFQCSLAFIPPILLHFSLRLADPHGKSRLPALAYGAAVLWCAVAVCTDWMDRIAVLGVFGASLIAVVLASVAVLGASIGRTPAGVQRRCVTVVLGGLVAFAALGIVDYLCIVLLDTYPFVSILGGLVFSSAMAWAVFSYHLFDLKDSLERAAAATAAFVALYLVSLLLSTIFGGGPGLRPLTFAVSILGAAFLVSPLGPRRPRELLHSFFFPDTLSLVDVAQRFQAEAEETRDADLLAAAFLKSVTAGLPSHAGALYRRRGAGLALDGFAGAGDPLLVEAGVVEGLAASAGEGRGGVRFAAGDAGGAPAIDVLAMRREGVQAILLLKASKRGRRISPMEARFLEIAGGAFAAGLSRIGEREARDPAPRARVTAFGPLIGGGEAMQGLYAMIRRIAPSDSTVLIQGESGSGKELVAEMLHGLSRRNRTPFIAVNCATLTGGLLQSELFGHEEGAFTGAVARRIGRFEQAHGGTLLLDEIGEMPLATQAMLLRVIEEKEIVRIGGREPIAVDVRVIAATNRDLAKEVRDRSFREDLFYRLNVIPIAVPPLRERREDIPLLVEYFVRQCAERFSKDVKGVNRAALKVLAEHRWPGNVRELANAVERAVLMAEGDLVTAEEIMLEEAPSEAEFSLKNAGEESEKSLIVRALAKTGGNVTRTAALIGVSRVTLQKKMKRYGLRKLAG